MRSLATQRKVQLQLDYNQKEQAFLNSFVALMPKFLANNMIDGSITPTRTVYTNVEQMSSEAATASRLQGNYDTQLTTFGLDNHVSANTGASNTRTPLEYVGFLPSTAAEPADWRGSTTNTARSTSFPPKFTMRGTGESPLSQLPSDHTANTHKGYALQKMYITSSNAYANNDLGPRHPNLIVDPVQYPYYNLIPYPNIAFGYGTPGEPFVARQNWWRLFMQTEAPDAANTNIAVNTEGTGDDRTDIIDREYIVSLYEIPSQLAITADTFLDLGSFSSGEAWNNNISVSGGIYAERVNTSGSINIERLSSKQTNTINAGTSVGKAGQQLQGGNAITKSVYEATNMDFFPVAKSSDSSKSIFVDLSQGNAFFDRFATAYLTDPNGQRASYDNFYQYTRGCNQTAMKLDITELAGDTPISVTFTYLDTGGLPATINLSTALDTDHLDYWPQLENEPRYDTLPFILKQIPNHALPGTFEVAIEFHVNRLEDYLASLPNAADLTVNHSITVNPDYISGTDVTQPPIPSDGTFPVVVLHGTEDLTVFTSGFSYVSNLKTYFETHLNNVETAPPAGFTPTGPYYIPVSIFAPEIRYGTGTNARIDIQGRVGSLARGNANGINVLDLKKGDGAVDTTTIQAQLEAITHPCQIPPVNIMNWLIVVNRLN